MPPVVSVSSAPASPVPSVLSVVPSSVAAGVTASSAPSSEQPASTRDRPRAAVRVMPRIVISSVLLVGSSSQRGEPTEGRRYRVPTADRHPRRLRPPIMTAR
ncbi:hypothetical protein [Ornithinimicrobium kibberense]|uniref:hypothetical protein n=1 Tax=Ornithinimicrobium kibberense TaxID=282060 RepID=UPI00361046AE